MPIEREAAIINAYQDGIKLDDIVKEFNTSISQIYRLLKRNNLPYRSKVSNKQHKHTETTKQQISEFKKIYWSKISDLIKMKI